MTMSFSTSIVHKQYDDTWLKSSWRPFIEIMWFLSQTSEDFRQQKVMEIQISHLYDFFQLNNAFLTQSSFMLSQEQWK